MPPPRVLLTFHGIGRPGRPLEPGEAPFWVAPELFLRVADLAAAEPGAIGLTFDDGNASDVEIGLPALCERGLRGSFFALSGRLDRPGSLRRADLATLTAAGMTVGLHGAGHVDWRRLDAAGREAEMVAARAALAEAAGQPVTAASVPFGRYDRGVLRALFGLGFAAVFTSDGGPAGRGPVWPRSSIRGEMTPETVADLVAGRMGLSRRLRRAVAMARKRLV